MVKEYYTCCQCGRMYKLHITLDNLDKAVQVVSCNICGLSICGKCGNWDQISFSKCPSCGAKALWVQATTLPIDLHIATIDNNPEGRDASEFIPSLAWLGLGL